MRNVIRRLDQILDAIDTVNKQDPRSFDGEPLAYVQGLRAVHWVRALDPHAGDALTIAARAHHLRRWEVLRSDFAEGRAGYLRWRSENKKHQRASVAPLLEAAGFDDTTIAHVGDLLLRSGLGRDADTQTLEDAACLVFLETQLSEMAARTEPDRMEAVLLKTRQKMSERALVLAAGLS